MKTKDRVIVALRISAGALFIFAGLSKLIQPSAYFQVVIGFYHAVPESLIPAIAIIVPWIELIFGSFLLLGYWERGSSGILATLSAVFQIMLAQALLRHLPMDECGCFGGNFIHLTLYQSFALDTILVLVLIQIATSEKTFFGLDNALLE